MIAAVKRRMNHKNLQEQPACYIQKHNHEEKSECSYLETWFINKIPIYVVYSESNMQAENWKFFILKKKSTKTILRVGRRCTKTVRMGKETGRERKALFANYWQKEELKKLSYSDVYIWFLKDWGKEDTQVKKVVSTLWSLEPFFIFHTLGKFNLYISQVLSLRNVNLY